MSTRVSVLTNLLLQCLKKLHFLVDLAAIFPLELCISHLFESRELCSFIYIIYFAGFVLLLSVGNLEIPLSGPTVVE